MPYIPLSRTAYITNLYSKSFSAKVAKGDKKVITVKILNAQGSFVPVSLVFDSGNDVTLFTTDTAKMLGFYGPNVGSPIQVSGINGDGKEFRMIKNYIQFGNMMPRQIKMAFAVNDGDLPTNLLGNKDILDSGNYTVTLDEDTVTIREKNGNDSSPVVPSDPQQAVEAQYAAMMTKSRIRYI